MHKEFLDLIPTRYLCPICGEWHEWHDPKPLRTYTSEEPADFSDDRFYPHECAQEEYAVYIEGNDLHFSTRRKLCVISGFLLSDNISIDSIKEDTERPIVTFYVDFTSNYKVNRSECSFCNFRSKCNLLKLERKYDCRMKIPLGFEFNEEDYKRVARKLQQTREKRDNKLNQPKEEKTMANNFLNQTFEFGVNTDKNIVSTLMGIAVNNGESWRIYDKEKEEITDVGDLQLGNLPIYLMPTTKLEVGDLIKDSGGDYYFVVKAENGKTQTLCAKTGEIKTVVPVKNILGLSIYTKVIALVDSLDIGKDFDVENLAIMSAMFGAKENGAQMNQMLPIMLFKDKFGSSSDDMMKMMCMTSMMTSPSADDNQMNQMLPLMLLNKDSDDEDDMMKMIAVSSMIGGCQEGAGNPFMSYLLLDMLKKKDSKPVITLKNIDEAPENPDDIIEDEDTTQPPGQENPDNITEDEHEINPEE